MQQEPTALRMEDPGIRDMFSDEQRLQSWLDVEAALAQAEAELGIVPDRGGGGDNAQVSAGIHGHGRYPGRTGADGAWACAADMGA